MSIKVTPHFYYHEFRPKARPKTWMPTNQYQRMLMENLAQNLQVIRSAMPENSSIQITSGLRAPADYKRLKKNGYNPSTTSDHNFGNAVPLKINTPKFKKYGPTYNFSVGAADCVPTGMSTIDLFHLAIDLTKNNKCRFGQVIYEKNPATGAEWVHFGGDPKFVFSDNIIQFLNRTQFMESLDGGKSYNGISV